MNSHIWCQTLSSAFVGNLDLVTGYLVKTQKNNRIKPIFHKMKHQQVVVDYVQMFKTSVGCVLLAFFGWILIKYDTTNTVSLCQNILTYPFLFSRLVYAVFMLPGYLEQSHQQIQRTLAKHATLLEENEENPVAATETDTNTEPTQDHQNEAVAQNEPAPALDTKKLN